MRIAMPPSFWTAEEERFFNEIQGLLIRVYKAGAVAGADIMAIGARDLVNWNVVSQNAINYVRRYKLDWIRKISETTRTQITNAIDDWLNSGQRLDALKRILREIPTLGKNRADMIAITEVTRIFGAGNQSAWQASRVVGQKQWATAKDERVCPICGKLDGMKVSINGDFWVEGTGLGSDVQVPYPPIHTRCRCALRPIVDLNLYDQELANILGGEYKAKLRGQAPLILEKGLYQWLNSL